MAKVNLSRQKLYDVVDKILKRKDLQYAKIYAAYHPRYGVTLKYYGAQYNKDKLPFVDGVEYLDLTECFDSVSKMLIVTRIMDKIDVWLGPKLNKRSKNNGFI